MNVSMHMFRLLCIIVVAVGLGMVEPATSFADNFQLVSGQYIREGGDGQLTLKKINGNRFRFSIFVREGNTHECGIDGEIEKTHARVGGMRPCYVNFRPTEDGIEVSAESDGCRDYCGVRAAFSGKYLLPVQGCSQKEVSGTRKKFKKLYDNGEFLKAKNTLEPLLSKCQATLKFIDESWIRNDIAITNYHLRNFAACVSILEPLAADAKSYEGANIADASSPGIMELFPVMKATLTNMKLCHDR